MQMIYFFADNQDFFSLSTLLPFTVSQFLSCFLSVSPRRVKHLNILQLVDVFETRKEYFLFLELWVLWDFHMWEWIRKYKSVNGYVCIYCVYILKMKQNDRDVEYIIYYFAYIIVDYLFFEIGL